MSARVCVYALKGCEGWDTENGFMRRAGRDFFFFLCRRATSSSCRKKCIGFTVVEWLGVCNIIAQGIPYLCNENEDP